MADSFKFGDKSAAAQRKKKEDQQVEFRRQRTE